MTYSASLITISGGTFAFLLRYIAQVDTILLYNALFVILNITLMILYIINYKCSTYNRLSGYRQLLSSERYFGTPKKIEEALNQEVPDNNISYDMCMEYLNEVNYTKEFNFLSVKDEFFAREGVLASFKDSNAGNNFSAEKIDRYVAQAFPSYIDCKGLRLQGHQISKKCLKNRGLFDGHDSDVKYEFPCSLYAIWNLFLWPVPNKKGSWKFPDFINKFTLYVCALQLAVILYLAIPDIVRAVRYPSSVNAPHFMIVFQIIVAFIVVHKISIVWQNLAFGCRRSYSYFLQFMPFRMIYLMYVFPKDEKTDKFEIRPYYVGMSWKLPKTP